MKAFFTVIATMFLFAAPGYVWSQNNNTGKRPMFGSLSDRIPAALSELEKTFSAKPGQAVDYSFRNMQFRGTVISSVKRYENLYSAVIRNDANGTLLSISKRINDDKSITYVGRIINNKATDGFELKKNADDTYTFHKIQMEELIQDY